MRGSEEALLLRELRHRVSLEVADALAALEFVRAARTAPTRRRILAQAALRLEGFAELNRLLARSARETIDIAPTLADVCAALSGGRILPQESRVMLDLATVRMDVWAAHRMLLIAAELVGDAIRHALLDRVGRVRVALRASGDEVALTVEDDAPGPRLPVPRDDDDLGQGIVLELVGRSNGNIAVTTAKRGTRIVVVMSSGLDEVVDDVPF